ncbi:MAG TPA: GTP-binding protein, partial [Streptomyces sp.]|nr:GTP-binding protein [Streptomyces sp.]
LVEVVDAAEFAQTRQRHPEIDRHLALADLVVVNKLDRVEDGERILALVRSLGERAAVVPATYGRVDPEFLFDCRPSEERVGQLSFDDLPRHDHDDHDDHDGHGGHDGHGEDDGHEHAGHLHTGYDSVAFVSDVPLDPRRLMQFLDGRADGLYRIKGYVDFGPYDPRNRYAVHAVGRFLRFYPEPWADGEDTIGDDRRLTQLVLIGAGIDAPALYKELEACRGDKDAPHADEHGMWGVLRYVQEAEAEDPEASYDNL